jgi:hypothetical protein
LTWSQYANGQLLRHNVFGRTVAAMATSQHVAQSPLWQSIEALPEEMETSQQIIDRIVAGAPPLVGANLSTVCTLTGLLPVNRDPAPADT